MALGRLVQCHIQALRLSAQVQRTMFTQSCTKSSEVYLRIQPSATKFRPMQIHTYPSLLSIKMFDGDKQLLEPPKNVNYFELFDIEQSFNLDSKALSKKFKNMQKVLHPDKFAQKKESDRILSEMWSSHVNNGYNKLLKPLDRALYLLELMGKPLVEGEIATDANFLAEIMEINEEVSEAESVTDIAGISQHNKGVLKDYVEKVSKAFGEGDVQKARELIARMKYYSTIQDKIKEREVEMKLVDFH